MSGPISIPIRLEAALLRTQLPELVLREGMVMAARVLDRTGPHGVLSMAGRQIRAELPPNLLPGAEVRLVVQEAGTERVVLRVLEQPQAAQAQAAQTPLVAVPLPDGSQARLAVVPDEQHEGGGAGGARASAVNLTWQSPALGTLSLRLTLEPTVLHAVIEAGPRAIDAVREGAGALRHELGTAAGRPADVQVIERDDPSDVYV
jgi:hypothetical protein